jgi:histidinol phosphatase-like enzyme
MENTHKKLIILSRDGVINQAVRDIVTTPDEWVAIEGSLLPFATCDSQKSLMAGYVATRWMC